MNTNQMRHEILKRYPSSDSFRRKVDKMSDAQIYAFYNRLIKKEQ